MRILCVRLRMRCTHAYVLMCACVCSCARVSCACSRMHAYQGLDWQVVCACFLVLMVVRGS